MATLALGNGLAHYRIGNCHVLAIRRGLRYVGVGAAGQRARCRKCGRIGSVLYLGSCHHHDAQVDRQGYEPQQSHQRDGDVYQNHLPSRAPACAGMMGMVFPSCCQLPSLDITAVP